MKELERDLNLTSVLAISIGAMIGSGIFILPALAIEEAGPSVIIAYALAGLLVVPAALSKSEMATAMPEAGGTYIYIERGIGPLLGTIAGVGTWFSLSFKGALALVGGVPYLLLLIDLPMKPVALGLAAMLVLVNILGVKQTGRFQTIIVVVMLIALGWFAAWSSPSVQGANYVNFFKSGIEGVFATTGLIFVSYAGVTKITSVAEEIENPGKNIPLGILGSLAFTTILYVVIVSVLVGITDPGTIAGSLTPVAVAAKETLGQAGVIAVIIAAILALISTANAGILSSSRYPLAMSRDELVPKSLSKISDRFGTPINSITLTGSVLLFLIAFLPILDIAKLASTFQILVFALINLAVIAFRKGDDSYNPEFKSPLYPWMQIFGVVTGIGLLTQMGGIAHIGALLITLGSIVWYATYVQPRVSREGAAKDVVRRQVGRNALKEIQSIKEEDSHDVLVPLTNKMNTKQEKDLVALGADLVRRDEGRVIAVLFEEIPDQAPLSKRAEVQMPSDISFETRMDNLENQLDIEIEADEVVTHDSKHAIVNFAKRYELDAILSKRNPDWLQPHLLSNPIKWIIKHATCDVLLVNNLVYRQPKQIALSWEKGAYPPLAVNVAEAIAEANKGMISLWYPFSKNSTEQHEKTIKECHQNLSNMLSVPVIVEPFRTESGEKSNPDILIQCAADKKIQEKIFRDYDTSKSPEYTTITVHPHKKRKSGLLHRLLEKITFYS